MENLQKNQQQTGVTVTTPQTKELSKLYLGELNKDGLESAIIKKKIISEVISGDNPNFPVILEKGTQLKVIENQIGTERLVMVIGLMLTEFCSSFNTRNPMSNDQIADLAIELATEYWEYKLEDFISFFALAKRGRYGKIYDRLDAPVIYGLLAEYHKDRQNGIFEIQIQYTKNEKQGRDRPRGGDVNDKITMLAGAMSKFRETWNKNSETINKLDPDKR